MERNVSFLSLAVSEKLLTEFSEDLPTYCPWVPVTHEEAPLSVRCQPFLEYLSPCMNSYPEFSPHTQLAWDVQVTLNPTGLEATGTEGRWAAETYGLSSPEPSRGPRVAGQAWERMHGFV